jgi:DNA-directed RNA polymerase subunit alpha
MAVSYPQKPDLIMLRPVDELKVSGQTLEALKEANIHYIGDLTQRTQTELLQRAGISTKAVAEIRKALQVHGLDLGMR